MLRTATAVRLWNWMSDTERRAAGVPASASSYKSPLPAAAPPAQQQQEERHEGCEGPSAWWYHAMTPQQKAKRNAPRLITTRSARRVSASLEKEAPEGEEPGLEPKRPEVAAAASLAPGGGRNGDVASHCSMHAVMFLREEGERPGVVCYICHNNRSLSQEHRSVERARIACGND